jgi:hypothetical protein
LENRYNTTRIIDSKGQLIARTEMGAAAAVEIRDALNHWGNVKKARAAQIEATHRINKFEINPRRETP